MRRNHLLRSVNRLLGPGQYSTHAAYLSSRHQWMMAFAAAAFLGLVGASAVAGFAEWSSRIGIGLAAAAVAVWATSEYRVVAATSQGTLLCRASRFRQVATGGVDHLAASVDFERTGSTMIFTEWRIGEQTFSVSKGHDRELAEIAALHDAS